MTLGKTNGGVALDRLQSCKRLLLKLWQTRVQFPPSPYKFIMKYKIEKLIKIIERPGRRKFHYKIIRLFPQGKEEPGATVFMFENRKIAEQTLEKLNEQ